MHWVGNQDGRFTIASAYDLLNQEDNDTGGWQWLWKLKVPQKLKTFLWQIWKNRNKKSFDNIDVNPCANHRKILAYSFEMTEAFKSPLYNGTSNSLLIRWFPPLTAGVKLNTDGCVYESNGKAGFGGLCKDHEGKWLLGCYRKLNSLSVLEAELWSIYRGLTIMFEKGYIIIHIETDSLAAVQLINADSNEVHPNNTLIYDSKMLLRITQSVISRIYREANSSADHLARLGAKHEENLVVIETSPQSVRIFVGDDWLGRSRTRD